MKNCVYMCIGYCLIVLTIAEVKLRKVGEFSYQHAAFANFYRNNNAKSARDKYDLLLTSFSGNPFTGGTVGLVRGIGNHMNNLGAIQIEQLASRLSWPNEVAGVPEHIFGKRMVAVPDGFLVPFKGDGFVYVIDISGPSPQGPYKLTDHTEGQWFYHRVLWKDMDGDGDDDLVTCRTRQPILTIFSSKDSELLWLENPSSHSYSSPWKQHVITHGPDVYFRNIKINTADGEFDVIATTEFFTKKLTIHWTTDSQNRWSDLSKVHSRTVDTTAGALFDIEVNDVNGDGRQDLLVVSNGMNGSVLVYEIPNDFRVDNFPRHTIATGFVPRTSGQGKGAPGSAFIIRSKESADKSFDCGSIHGGRGYPADTYSSWAPDLPSCNHSPTLHCFVLKPDVLVSGDDDGRAYILEPNSNDRSDWSYTKTTFHDAGSGTVGQMVFADVDGDDFTDIFVPNYNLGTVTTYTYAPNYHIKHVLG